MSKLILPGVNQAPPQLIPNPSGSGTITNPAWLAYHGMGYQSPMTVTPTRNTGGGGGSGSDVRTSSTNTDIPRDLTPTPPPYDPLAAQRAAEQAQMMADTQAAIDATRRNLEAQDKALSNRYSSIDSEYNTIISQYEAEMARNRSKYDDQMASNEGTRDRNRHLGLVSAAQGGRGLNATLGSLGALDESGSRLASRAVAQAANMDLGEADRTFDTNVNQLSTAWGDVRQDDEMRKQEAARAKATQRDSALYEYDQSRAGLYEKLAENFGKRKDSANASKYTRQAGDITAAAAERPRAMAQAFQPRAAKFEAGQLANYLAGQNNMSVNVAGGGANGAPQLFANNRRRTREEELA